MLAFIIPGSFGRIQHMLDAVAAQAYQSGNWIAPPLFPQAGLLACVLFVLVHTVIEVFHTDVGLVFALVEYSGWVLRPDIASGCPAWT